MTSAVDVRDLAVSFGRFRALEKISFAIEHGSFLAILGPNGSGKTTLLRVLLGLAQPSSGSVQVLGNAPGESEPSSIGYVPQVKTLDRSFPAHACELVVSGLRRSWPWRITETEHRQAIAALELVGAAALEHRSLATLSGGELQRVYLARALVRKPQLLLLDEPAAGIDVVGESDMYSVLERCHREGMTVVMVTHDWGAAYHHATHALLLDRRMISFGPSAVALSDENMRSAFGHSGHSHAMVASGAHQHGHQQPHGIDECGPAQQHEDHDA
jgi:zinc transport system ATP-binding protein